MFVNILRVEENGGQVCSRLLSGVRLRKFKTLSNEPWKDLKCINLRSVLNLNEIKRKLSFRMEKISQYFLLFTSN